MTSKRPSGSPDRPSKSAREFGDADIRAWGLLQQGRLLIAGGRNDEGFSLLEEATIAAVNGELNPFIDGRGVLQHDRLLSRHDRLPASK